MNPVTPPRNVPHERDVCHWNGRAVVDSVDYRNLRLRSKRGEARIPSSPGDVESALTGNLSFLDTARGKRAMMGHRARVRSPRNLSGEP